MSKKLHVILGFLFCTAGITSNSAQLIFADGFDNMIRVSPTYYDQPLKNPMKGFTGSPDHEWANLRHRYFEWNELENDVSDGMDKILQVTNQKFQNGPENNLKFIPRLYLHWDNDETYWPDDMTEFDYTSEQFQFRVTRIIERLGEAWNNDPRVAFVELGIFGKWGEHHSPDPTLAMQNLTGQAFQNAFPNKKVSVRHIWKEFQGFGFGEYWDSWGHYQQMWGHGKGIADQNQANQTYLDNYIGGEVAYNWGDSEIQPGSSPTDSVSDPIHREFIQNSIRWLHGTQLRWISDYDENNAAARVGAAELQKVMGYRYMLNEVQFTPKIVNNELRVSLSVTNEGSAPFYYDWPVEVALHNPDTREVVWQQSFDELDIRSWHPGENWTPPEFEAIDNWPSQAVIDGWSTESIGWGTPPVINQASDSFIVNLPDGEYVLSLSVLDPAGMQPSLRFATSHYWNGARHPLGIVSVGGDGGGVLADNFSFDDPKADDSLSYQGPE